MTADGIEIRVRRLLLAVALTASVLLPPGVLAGDERLEKIPGYVDGAVLIETAGEQALSVEVNLSGPLLKALTKWDPDLAELAGRLESIHAVILDLEDKATATRIRDLVRETRRNLTRQGWQTITTVREEGSELNVLTLSDGEMIQGLLVLMVDAGAGEVVFANVAGILDLAALERLGEELKMPGLDELTDE